MGEAQSEDSSPSSDIANDKMFWMGPRWPLLLRQIRNRAPLYKSTEILPRRWCCYLMAVQRWAAAYRYKVIQITPHDGDRDVQIRTRGSQTDLTAIKAKHDNLPADPALEANVQGHVGGRPGRSTIRPPGRSWLRQYRLWRWRPGLRPIC